MAEALLWLLLGFGAVLLVVIVACAMSGSDDDDYHGRG